MSIVQCSAPTGIEILLAMRFKGVAMAFCGNCGVGISGAMEYCPSCGHAARAYQAVSTVATTLKKADLGKRFIGALIDQAVLPAVLGGATYGVLAVLYSVFRDCVKGRSIGRLLSNLVLVDVKTGVAADSSKAISRDLVAMLTLLTVIGGVIDILLVLSRSDGRRIADLLVGTQVTGNE
jgi:hypothetical protein